VRILRVPVQQPGQHLDLLGQRLDLRGQLGVRAVSSALLAVSSAIFASRVDVRFMTRRDDEARVRRSRLPFALGVTAPWLCCCHR
jgi:hypothetical protein